LIEKVEQNYFPNRYLFSVYDNYRIANIGLKEIPYSFRELFDYIIDKYYNEITEIAIVHDLKHDIDTVKELIKEVSLVCFDQHIGHENREINIILIRYERHLKEYLLKLSWDLLPNNTKRNYLEIIVQWLYEYIEKEYMLLFVDYIMENHVNKNDLSTNTLL